MVNFLPILGVDVFGQSLDRDTAVKRPPLNLTNVANLPIRADRTVASSAQDPFECFDHAGALTSGCS